VAPSDASVSPQLPAEQVGALQAAVVVQVLHSTPPTPHALAALPDWQLLPSQQPLQQTPSMHLAPVVEQQTPPHGS
jgi:hypothetical protein